MKREVGVFVFVAFEELKPETFLAGFEKLSLPLPSGFRYFQFSAPMVSFVVDWHTLVLTLYTCLSASVME